MLRPVLAPKPSLGSTKCAGLPGADYIRASMHALRGNDRDVLASLQLAIESGWSKLWFVERDPIFAGYRGDPNFESIVELLKAKLGAERQELLRLAEAKIGH